LEGFVDEIGLPEAIEAVRGELRASTEQAAWEDIQFPVSSVELQFQVGVTRERSGTGKLKVWIIELGGGAGHKRQDVQAVIVKLDGPGAATGSRIKVQRRSREKP